MIEKLKIAINRLKEQGPILVLRTWLMFLTDRESFLRNVLAEQWPNKLHPLAFYAGCYSLFAVFQPLIPEGQIEVKWFAALSNLDVKMQARFLIKMGVDYDKDELGKMFVLANLFPGSSNASDRIRHLVAYFGEADHRFRSKPTTRFGLMATTCFTDGDHRSARGRWASVSDL